MRIATDAVAVGAVAARFSTLTFELLLTALQGRLSRATVRQTIGLMALVWTCDGGAVRVT